MKIKEPKIYPVLGIYTLNKYSIFNNIKCNQKLLEVLN